MALAFLLDYITLNKSLGSLARDLCEKIARLLMEKEEPMGTETARMSGFLGLPAGQFALKLSVSDKRISYQSDS